MLGGVSLAALWAPKRQAMGFIRSYAILQLKLLWRSSIQDIVLQAYIGECPYMCLIVVAYRIHNCITTILQVYY
jgi:hypothetical protein